MSAACVICAGASGRPLSGKRCTASSCKAAYSRRLREAKRARMDEGADSSQPTRAPSPASATTPGPEVSVAGFELWELRAVYGRRDYDPDLFTDYERRNGVNPDREKRRAVLAFAHYKEDSDDDGKSVHGWIGLEELLQTLSGGELVIFDHYMQNNPNQEWDSEVERLKAALGEGVGEEAAGEAEVSS
jgi:hypothetical protein